MQTIWKFSAPINDSLTIEMPAEAQLLSVDTQFGEPQLWALVDSDNPKEKRHFAWRGTGHNCNGLRAIGHVGTIQMHSGQLVFHLFEISE